MTEVEIRQIESFVKGAFIRGAEFAALHLGETGLSVGLLDQAFEVWIQEVKEDAEVEK